MTDPEWASVATALLGSWPSLVASWGREAIAAYLGELRARGVSADAALVAIRSCPAEQAFPPSAPQLAVLACRDPDQPTYAEMLEAVFGPGGVVAARTTVRKAVWQLGERERLNDEAAWEHLAQLHPLIREFVRGRGLRRLRDLNLNQPEYGEARRKLLRDEWEEHVDTTGSRDLRARVELAGGHRGELGRLDPLLALSGTRQIERSAS